MSDTRRTFIGKLLGALSLPALVLKALGKPSYRSSDVEFSKWMKAHPSRVRQPHFIIEKYDPIGSGRDPDSGPAPRIIPRGWRMKRTPSSRMMDATRSGYQMEFHENYSKMSDALIMIDAHGDRVTSVIVNGNVVLTCYDKPGGCTLSGKQFADLVDWVEDQFERMEA